MDTQMPDTAGKCTVGIRGSYSEGQVLPRETDRLRMQEKPHVSPCQTPKKALLLGPLQMPGARPQTSVSPSLSG